MPELTKPPPPRMRIRSVNSKSPNRSRVARNVLCGTSSVSEPPTIIPSATRHHRASSATVSQPSSVRPSKSGRGSAAPAHAARQINGNAAPRMKNAMIRSRER